VLRRAVDPSARQLARLAARHRQRLHTLLSVASGLVLLVWSVCLIAWLALHWLILPHIDEWRLILELRDLRLHDRQRRESLYLARVRPRRRRNRCWR
jgi:hypothetical protein